jgi:hypothetical protein
VAFDFDLCSLKANLLDAIDSLSLKGVLDTILTNYLDLSDNELFQSDIVQRIKDVVVGEGEKQVDGLKNHIKTSIEGIDCSSRRHLSRLLSGSRMEVTSDGDVQRDLQVADDTFGFLTDLINDFEFIDSVSAGYIASRDEIAVDVGIIVDGSLTGDDFRSALQFAFDKLDGAKDLFGATSSAQIDDLLGTLFASANFKLDISFGLKAGNLESFFAGDVTKPPVDGMFLRVNQLTVEAAAGAEDVSVVLFSTSSASVEIDSGALSLSVGVSLASPYEVGLDIETGEILSELDFETITTGRFEFEPSGHFFATLPLVATVSGEDWGIGFIFEDENLFEPPGLSARLDFDACQVVEALQLLLARLGSLSVSPDSILGPNFPFSGIDFNLTSFDSIFPDLGPFVEGILSAKSELFHLCSEVCDCGGPCLVLCLVWTVWESVESLMLF